MLAMRGLVGGRLALLSTGEIESIHVGSLHILEETGIHIDNERALRILREAGARVDHENRIVRFPPPLVEDAVRKTPSRVVLCGRDPRHDLVLEGHRVHMGSGGLATTVIDPHTGVRRQARLRDLIDLVRLIDALEHIHFCVHPVQPLDVPLESWEVNGFYHAISNTSKHNMGGPGSREALRQVIKMAEIIAGGAKNLRARPIISIITNALSPLKLDPHYVDILLDAAIYGIPVTCAPAPVAGSTAPVTLAGTLVQQNAETLAGLVLVQAANPGTPFLYGAVPGTSNLRNMNLLFGSVEAGLMNACAVQMAKYYNVPIYASAGVSDAKVPDAQAGYEKALTSLLVAMAGGNYIHLSAGLLDSGLAVAYEQYVIDNEINGNVLRAVRGVEVDKDRLAVDVISRVGPGGNFLAEEHTVRYMRGEFYQPVVQCRDNYSRWEAAGGLDSRERARLRVTEILAHHQPLPLPEEVKKRTLQEIPGLIP